MRSACVQRARRAEGGWASGKWTLPSGRAVAKAIQAIAARAGEAAAEPAALPAPNGQSSEAALEPAPLPKSKHKPNRLMLEADTEVGPSERKPRKGRVPSPPGAARAVTRGVLSVIGAHATSTRRAPRRQMIDKAPVGTAVGMHPPVRPRFGSGVLGHPS